MRLLLRSTACLVLAVLAAGCSSDSSSRPTPNTPEGVQEVRETLSAQRESTLSQMDTGSSPNGAAGDTAWWDPFMDGLDFLTSGFGLFR